MDKPLLYDTFCGAGGATRGYQQAGFRVIGVDDKPQPRYCGDGFVQMDALDFLAQLALGEFEKPDAIHASPPCQFATMASRQWRQQGRRYPDLIGPTRERLQTLDVPWVIENVPGAPLQNITILNGAMFGLRVRRTRWFETSFPIPFFLLPREERSTFRMGRPVVDGGIITPVGHFSNVTYAQKVMEIDWMGQADLAQAIPPAYCEYVGQHLLRQVQR